MAQAELLDGFDAAGTAELDRPRARPRIAPEIEKAILERAFSDPAAGQDRVARDLRARRLFVSASGVRYVWQRHNLATLERRVDAISKKLAGHEAGWTPAQLAARDRIRRDVSARRAAKKVMGSRSPDFDRALYILTIAAKLFREQGYDATSLRDVARAARIPVGSLHYHYSSKEELFEAVYEEGIRRLTELVESAVSRSTTPLERLRAACAAHVGALCHDEDNFMAAAIPTRTPNISARTTRTLVLLNSRYEAIFKLVIGGLRLPTGISPSVLRLLILGALNWTSTWYKPGKASPEEIANTLINILRLRPER
jgi:TetR/AcrR family transcriptional regulator, cholesterol catabolism regulator